jgi:hypothetical protein
LKALGKKRSGRGIALLPELLGAAGFEGSDIFPQGAFESLLYVQNEMNMLFHQLEIQRSYPREIVHHVTPGFPDNFAEAGWFAMSQDFFREIRGSVDDNLP